MNESEMDLDLDELSSAEDFLDYFGIAYDPVVIHVNRLHVLQRFHDYLARLDEPPDDDDAKRAIYTRWLTQAYDDFVVSNAQTEKVFKVFKTNEPLNIEIPLNDLTAQVPGSATEV